MIKNLLTSVVLTGCAVTTTVGSAHAANLGCSQASYYGVGDGYHGQRTANGEVFDAYKLTAAHRSLPFGTKLKVSDQETGKSVIVRINDRGPFIDGRNLDLSYAAFAAINSPSRGVIKVCMIKI